MAEIKINEKDRLKTLEVKIINTVHNALTLLCDSDDTFKESKVKVSELAKGTTIIKISDNKSGMAWCAFQIFENEGHISIYVSDYGGPRTDKPSILPDNNMKIARIFANEDPARGEFITLEDRNVLSKRAFWAVKAIADAFDIARQHTPELNITWYKLGESDNSEVKDDKLPYLLQHLFDISEKAVWCELNTEAPRYNMELLGEKEIIKRKHGPERNILKSYKVTIDDQYRHPHKYDIDISLSYWHEEACNEFQISFFATPEDKMRWQSLITILPTSKLVKIVRHRRSASLDSRSFIVMGRIFENLKDKLIEEYGEYNVCVEDDAKAALTKIPGEENVEYPASATIKFNETPKSLKDQIVEEIHKALSILCSFPSFEKFVIESVTMPAFTERRLCDIETNSVWCRCLIFEESDHIRIKVFDYVSDTGTPCFPVKSEMDIVKIFTNDKPNSIWGKLIVDPECGSFSKTTRVVVKTITDALLYAADQLNIRWTSLWDYPEPKLAPTEDCYKLSNSAKPTDTSATLRFDKGLPTQRCLNMLCGFDMMVSEVQNNVIKYRCPKCGIRFSRTLEDVLKRKDTEKGIVVEELKISLHNKENIPSQLVEAPDIKTNRMLSYMIEDNKEENEMKENKKCVIKRDILISIVQTFLNNTSEYRPWKNKPETIETGEIVWSGTKQRGTYFPIIGITAIDPSDDSAGFEIWNTCNGNRDNTNIHIDHEGIRFIESSDFNEFGYEFIHNLYEFIKDNLDETNIKNQIENVIFSNPATTVIWTDGTKTTVQTQVLEYTTITKADGTVVKKPKKRVPFDPEAALAACIMNRMFGSHSAYAKYVNGYVVKSEAKKKKKKVKKEKEPTLPEKPTKKPNTKARKVSIPKNEGGNK